MRFLALLATAVVTSLATSQSPLLTLTGGTNVGNIGNNIYFDLQVTSTVTINRIDFWCGATTANQPWTANTTGGLTMYLGPTTYVGNTTNQSLWVQVAQVTGISVAPSTMATATLTSPICLGPGNYGVALKSASYPHGYTNGTCTSTAPGACTNGIFTNAELTLRAGANQNTPWSSGLNEPRIFNGGLYYTLGGTPIAVAAWQKYGRGCYSWYHSFMENFLNPSTSFDLKSTTGTNSLHLSFIGTGYLVGPFNTAGTFRTPTAAATNLNMGNDTVAQIPLTTPILYPTPTGVAVSTQVEVCSNGFVSPAASNGTAFSPTATLFLSGQPRWAGCWFDFDPSLGGQVNYEYDASGNLYISWIGVPDSAAAATSNTWQMVLFANSDVEYRYGVMSLNIGGTRPCLVGWTPGGNALNPGDIDISAITVPFTTGPTDNAPLDLTLSIRPQLGSTPAFITANIPTGTGVGGLLVSFGQVNGTDLGFLGMPNCRQYVDLNSAISNIFVATGSTASVNLTIPNLPVFNGQLLFGQSATFSSGYNPLGVIASNGVRLVAGSL